MGRQARQVKLHENHVDQGGYRRAPRLQHKVGHFTVQRIPDCIQIAQPGQWVCDLQQGSIDVMSKAPVDFLRGRLEVNNLSTRLEVLAIGRPKDCAASRRQDSGWPLRQRVDDFFFNVPKARFAFTLEKLADGAAQPCLDCMVRVYKGNMQSSGELTPNGGFSRTRQSNKTEYQLISDRSPFQQSFSE